MPSNIQENLPVAFAMLEKVPNKSKTGVFTAWHLTEAGAKEIVDG